jgi:hypothetical protein
MDQEITNLLFGVIFLVLFINTIMLVSIASVVYGTGSNQTITPSESTAYPVLASSVDTDPIQPLISLIPTPAPLGGKSAALPDTNVVLSGGSNPAIKSISSYVTIEPKESPEIETHTEIQPAIPQQYEVGFVTIYSLKNQKVSQVMPLVSFSLLNPPLVIDYEVAPVNATEVKYMEYKEINVTHEENLVITRPYENTWFMVIVRDKDTGELVTEDGFGRTYSFTSPRQLVLRENGNYSFEFTGDYAKLNLTIKVPKAGNFP